MKEPVNVVVAVFFAALGLIATSGLATTQPAHATASTAATTQSEKKVDCDKGNHPSNAKCGSYFQIYGSVGKYGSAAACDKSGQSIVDTNMSGRGDKYDRNYYTWACNKIPSGPSAGRWTLVVYWTQ